MRRSAGLLIAVVLVLLIPAETFVLAMVLPWLLVGGYAGPLIIAIMANLPALAYLRERRRDAR